MDEEKRILHLTIEKKWFDKIAKRVKKTEYREIKPYWTRRLFKDGKKKEYDTYMKHRNRPILAELKAKKRGRR